MKKRLVRFAVAAFVAAGLLAGARAPTAAQPSLGVSVGSRVYGEDHEFCLMSGAAITHYQADYSGDVFGVSASYVNSDVPCFEPPGNSVGASLVFPASALLSTGRYQGPVYLSQGGLITASVEVFPIAALLRVTNAEAFGRIDRLLRPFVGVGAGLLTDGEPAPPGGNRAVPTYSIRGFTAPLLSYGARLHLPSREGRISLLLQYRNSHLIVGDFDFETPDAERLAGDGETLTWGTLSIGASFRAGS
jgi:hypothetical protein